jgi:glycosyltransferase involved in cell wall biosynthesis
MRILYHHRIASKDGQFVHINEITSALDELGCEIEIVSPNVVDGSDFGSDGGYVSKLKAVIPKFIYELMELSYCGVIAYKLIKSILRNKPTFIYERYNLYQPVGVIISKIFNIPLLLEINAPIAQERAKFSGGLGIPWLAKAIENWTWRNADVCLPVTNVLAKDLVLAGVQRGNIRVIHNGIKQSIYEASIHKDIVCKKDITIGFVGFMHLTCGVEKAIELLAAHPEINAKLVCIGDGNILPSLRAKADKLGVSEKVDFKGLLSRDDVFNEICNFDIALQPAVTEYASPLKIFEYMVSKSLIIAPSMDNIKEILSDNSAILFDVNEVNGFELALEDAIINFSAHQDKRLKAFSTISEKGFLWLENSKRILAIAETLVSIKLSKRG